MTIAAQMDGKSLVYREVVYIHRMPSIELAHELRVGSCGATISPPSRSIFLIVCSFW